MKHEQESQDVYGADPFGHEIPRPSTTQTATTPEATSICKNAFKYFWPVAYLRQASSCSRTSPCCQSRSPLLSKTKTKVARGADDGTAAASNALYRSSHPIVDRPSQCDRPSSRCRRKGKTRRRWGKSMLIWLRQKERRAQ